MDQTGSYWLSDAKRPTYETGIDAASDREALDAPLSPVGTPPTNECEEVVDQIFTSSNPLFCWLRQVEALKRVASV